MIIKIGLLDGDQNIIETHWFHSAMQVVVIAMSPQEAQSIRATPTINTYAPTGLAKNPIRNSRMKEWAVHDWEARLATLPPSMNPFTQMSDGEGGAPIALLK